MPDAPQTFKFTTIERVCREHLDNLRDGKIGSPFLTGIAPLDKSMGGILKGETCVVGGRPSHGKSMFGLSWLYNVASEGVNCLFISEEMGHEAVAQRSIAYSTNYSRDNWKDRYEDVYDDVQAFWESRGKVQIVTGVGSAERAVQAIAQAVEYSGVEFVVADYLQILRAPGQSKYEQVSNASIAMKAASVNYNIGLVCLCQLSRESENDGGMPRMKHLKESGQIEQDADQILFVQWPLKNNPGHKPHDEYTVYCAKNRNRGIGESVIELRFQPSRQRLMPVPKEPVENHHNYSHTLANF